MLSPRPVRKPIQLEKRSWVDSSNVTILGVDPGLAKTGLIVLGRTAGVMRVLAHRLVTTKPPTKKEKAIVRMSVFDVRRFAEVHNALADLTFRHSVQAMAVEAYRVMQARGGNAWKVAAVYGGVVFWAMARDFSVFPFLPNDLKSTFCRRRDASKVEVEKAICRVVHGLSEALSTVRDNDREHLSDAAGHAVLGLQQMDDLRRVMGTR